MTLETVELCSLVASRKKLRRPLITEGLNYMLDQVALILAADVSTYSRETMPIGCARKIVSHRSVMSAFFMSRLHAGSGRNSLEQNATQRDRARHIKHRLQLS